MRKVATFYIIILLIFAYIPSIVLAQGVSTPVQSVITPQTRPIDKKIDRVTRDKTRQERLDKYKQKLSVKLSKVEERRIAGACRGAQKVVDRMQLQLTKVSTNRKAKYSKVAERLQELVAKLKKASVDTTKLEASIVGVNKIATSVVDGIANYQVTLSDLSAMDCQADPSGFKAALDTARQQRSDLVVLSQSIRSYVKGTIKPILADIRAGLVKDRGGSRP